MMAWPPWFTAVLVFPDQQLFVSPRLWSLLDCRSQGHSESLFPEYYSAANDCDSCFVRARRLNVIIQPHLRFM